MAKITLAMIFYNDYITMFTERHIDIADTESLTFCWSNLDTIYKGLISFDLIQEQYLTGPTINKINCDTSFG